VIPVFSHVAAAKEDPLTSARRCVVESAFEMHVAEGQSLIRCFIHDPRTTGTLPVVFVFYFQAFYGNNITLCHSIPVS
jgi:hypothetical protein